MKNLFLAFSLLIAFQLWSQKEGSATVFNAEITYNNGTTSKGKLDGFIVKKSLFGGKGDPFANLESDFNLRDTKFTFYPDGGEKLKLKSEEVSNVKLFKDDGDVWEFGRFKIMALDKKGNLKETKSELWLPYLRKDEISLLGFSAFDHTGKYVGTVTLFHREGDDYVIDPINLKVLDIFSMRKMMEKTEAGMVEVFKDCPETVKLVKGNFEKAQMERATSKEYRKKFMKDIKDLDKRTKKMSVGERMEAQGDFYSKLYMEGLQPYFDSYNENCAKN